MNWPRPDAAMGRTKRMTEPPTTNSATACYWVASIIESILSFALGYLHNP